MLATSLGLSVAGVDITVVRRAAKPAPRDDGGSGRAHVRDDEATSRGRQGFRRDRIGMNDSR